MMMMRMMRVLTIEMCSFIFNNDEDDDQDDDDADDENDEGLDY